MRKTAHGIVMSPRMERLWTYIRDKRKINLSDWSTDRDVQREFHRLKIAMDEAPTDEIKRDIANIMKRVPQNRQK